jgi:sulfite exporter TauE/SafE
MPCGLLQSALLVAALANDAMQGAAVMAAFAAGTSVSLWLVGSAWGRLRGSGLRWARLSLPVRLAGGLLAASSAFALFHGLGSAIDQALCL